MAEFEEISTTREFEEALEEASYEEFEESDKSEEDVGSNEGYQNPSS